MRELARALVVTAAIHFCGFMVYPAGAQESFPAFIAGKTFTGVGKQADGQEWRADLEFSAVKNPAAPSKLMNKTVACKANLFAVEVQPDRVIFKQRLTEGKNICIDLGYVEVVNDALTGLVILNYSHLRVMQPVESRAVLFDKAGQVPNESEMREATAKYAPTLPSIIGSWETATEIAGSWMYPRCDQMWDRSDKPWLPFDARGAISIWALPTEEGGKIYAAYAEDSSGEKIRWTELKHVNKSSFVADKAFSMIQQRIFLDVGETPNGQTDWLVIAPEKYGESSWEFSPPCL